VATFAVLTALVAGSAVASLAGSIQLPFVAVPPGLRWPARILFLALLVVGAVLSAVSLVTGWSVKSGVSGLKHRLIARLESRYLDELPREGPTANSQSPVDPLHEGRTQPSCLRM
jgi:hypothetical protein